YNIGFAYNDLGRYAEALAPLQQAVRVKPELAYAHSELGYTLQKLQRYQEAVTSFKQAIRLDPEAEIPHYYLGLTYLELKDRRSATDEYNILQKLNSQYAAKLDEELNK
ncbi:MAG: tetratricopeptide repeat protein, partial [Acidobacteria bacterium]|nr:tetratricopeptide repeat protein [Acidobacteriota bacterium]